MLLPLVVAACGATHAADPATTLAARSTAATTTTAKQPVSNQPAQRVLGLPPVSRSSVLPGYLLIADRDNNRAIIVSPSKQIVWERGGLHGPDDTFFTPGWKSVITNEEFNDTLTEVSLKTKAVVWRYGHDATPGSSPGYLDSPDDAYRLPNGDTTIADIKNCRIVLLSHDKKVKRIIGGSCAHNPPYGLSSPNGDTPLADGGLLISEIGGWITRLDANGKLVWSVRSPVAYPSDPQLLPNGRILVASFTTPGRIVELTPSGRVTWSFGDSSGPNRLDRPSLAVMLPNGLIASNDDWNHRVILIDPKTKTIVWQYGHTGSPGSAPGYLRKPDGLMLLPSAFTNGPAPARKTATTRAPATAARVTVTRVGSLPATLSKSAAVALPNGNVVVLGGLNANAVLAGPPSHLRAIGKLPTATHDAAAALRGGAVVLYGGGETTSWPTVLRVDPRTGSVRTLQPLDEPLSDLGAANVGGTTYLVGGYTGTKYATAILRVGANDHTTTVARLPTGLRYAGVAALGGKIYVAGGLTTGADSRFVYVVDPQAGTVDRLATLPAPAAHVALAAAGGTLYLVGGGSRDVLAIDPASGRVTKAATLPQALTDPSAVSLGSTAVVLGGGTNAVYAIRPQ